VSVIHSMTGIKTQNNYGHLIETKKNRNIFCKFIFLYPQYDIVDNDDKVVD